VDAVATHTSVGRTLGAVDVTAMIVGVVVGAGIFRAPGLVANGVTSEAALMAVWALGGVVSLVGALCYGELVTAFPSPGGEYHLLNRSFGRNLAFLFVWSRLTVTSAGAIALLAFIFGDYASTLLPLPGGTALYAASLVVVLTVLNALGLRLGTWVQKAFTLALVVGIACVAIAGLAVDVPDRVAVSSAPGLTLGLAMIFVLLTYGGWNEAAYLSAEVRGGRRRMALSLVVGVAAVSALYLLINAAYVRVLGLEGLRGSATVGADLVSAIAGQAGARIAAVLVATAVLTSANATIVTCSRSAYALGRDFTVFRALGHWDARAAAPVRALIAQAVIVLLLIAAGAWSRSGFETMVEYTAPVFWAFFLLTGLSLFVLRAKEPGALRPFRVPLYPLTPALFCAVCAWLLYSSLMHTRAGALAGVAVLALGVVPLWIERTRSTRIPTPIQEERA
jgi:amino acid transporter